MNVISDDIDSELVSNDVDECDIESFLYDQHTMYIIWLFYSTRMDVSWGARLQNIYATCE